LAWSDLTFGVELEVVAGGDNRQCSDHVGRLRTLLVEHGFSDDGWRAVHDGSVTGGGEVVSPVLKGESGLRQLESVCEKLKDAGYTANMSCGMHVHIGVRQFQVHQIARICRAFLNNEAHFDAVVSPSRRNNHYCRSNTQFSIPRDPRNMATLARAFNGGWEPNVHYTSFRYRKLNLQSYALHGTIEFRQHQGTVEKDRACNWVRLITEFCARAINGSIEGRMEFDRFAELGGQQQYFESRRNRFARQASDLMRNVIDAAVAA
jgi:hypothetical protein